MELGWVFWPGDSFVILGLKSRGSSMFADAVCFLRSVTVGGIRVKHELNSCTAWNPFVSAGTSLVTYRESY